MNTNQKTKGIVLKELENPLIKEAANLSILGIKSQDKGDFKDAKEKIEEGEKKLKQIITEVKDIKERNMLFSYINFFQSCIKDCSTQEENEKIAKENNFTQTLIMKEKQFITESNTNLLSLIKETENYRGKNPDKILDISSKIFLFFSKSNDKGFFLSKNIFIRYEIIRQGNAFIPYLYQKYEVCYYVNQRLSEFMLLMKQRAINENNIEGLINYLIDVQNWFSKELKYIKSCKFGKNVNNLNEKENTRLLYNKFDEYKERVKRNELNEKLSSKIDYFKVFNGVCNGFQNLKSVFEYKHYKQEFLKNINNKKYEICDIFYNTIIKWFIRDILELTKRFLNKNILNFENIEYQK